MNSTLKARVDDLVNHIQQGKILEAMNEFYAPDVAMQENNNPPVTGLDANVEREKQFLASVKEWRRTDISSVAVDEAKGKTLVQYVFDFVNTAGQPVHYDQVAVQTWKDGKIVHERFYYDTGAGA
jgi:ketosteroid isomerase-like protein